MHLDDLDGVERMFGEDARAGSAEVAEDRRGQTHRRCGRLEDNRFERLLGRCFGFGAHTELK